MTDEEVATHSRGVIGKTMPKRTNLFAVHLIIFLAGFTFLLYEVSWNRLLSLVLGTTVSASTIVLSSFMAGFGVGAYFWGRAVGGRRRPGFLLAGLLVGIGLFSVLDYFMFTLVIPHAYESLSGGVSLGILESLVFAFAAILLFVPAFLIGGIFPVISRIVIGSGGSISSSLGRLYALDTLGSTIGGLLTGFLLLGWLGQRNSVFVAVAINLLMAGWLLLTKKYNRIDQPDKDSSSSKHEHGKTSARKPQLSPSADAATLRSTALIGAFVCGFSILCLQVLWFRIFRIYFTNTSYTFALVSSIAILGLSVGSGMFKRYRSRARDHRRSMVGVILFMGLAVLFGLVILVYLPHILMFPFQTMLTDPFTRVLVLPFVAAVLIVLPPAIFSGYAFPLACRMYTAGRETIGRDVGFVLMVNTIGAVIGPVVAAFVLLPLIGATMSVVLILTTLAAAVLFILRQTRLPKPYRIVKHGFHALIPIMIILLIVGPDIRILPPSFSRFEREILFYRESVEGTLSVGQDIGTKSRTKYTYVNNSAVIGSTYDAVKVVKMVGHFPFFMGLDCSNVLVIGFGIGVTTSAIAAHPEVKSIECVELVEGLKDAARFYSDLNQNVIDDPRLEIIAGDGRHYLQLTSRKYDLISCDPTHPILGSGNLYTEEYFTLCREHLNPGGMVSQYLPLHKLRTEEFLGIIATFNSVFPNSTVWLGHYHAVLMGSTDPLEIDFDKWVANVERAGDDPRFYIDPYHLAATLALDGEKIAELATESRMNTDDLSYTEFFAPECLSEDNISKNLRFLIENRADVSTVFNDIEASAMMQRFVQGNRLLTESLYYKLRGDDQRSLELLQQACLANPEDQEYPFLIRLYY